MKSVRRAMGERAIREEDCTDREGTGNWDQTTSNDVLPDYIYTYPSYLYICEICLINYMVAIIIHIMMTVNNIEINYGIISCILGNYSARSKQNNTNCVY